MDVAGCYWDVDVDVVDAIVWCVKGAPLQCLPSLAGVGRSVPELTGPTALVKSMSSVSRLSRSGAGKAQIVWSGGTSTALPLLASPAYCHFGLFLSAQQWLSLLMLHFGTCLDIFVTMHQQHKRISL